jgi:GT2 family glycosyltransferase
VPKMIHVRAAERKSPAVPSAAEDDRAGHSPSPAESDGEKQASQLNGLHDQLRQVQQVLARQGEHLERLAQQASRAADEQDQVQATLEDVREVIKAKPNQGAALSSYERLVRRIRACARAHIPRYTTIIVISKGDSELINLPGRTGWHFPRNAAGDYSGYHPACSSAAIAHLEALRAEGAEYFLIPSTAFWWLEHYRAFGQHLDQYYQLVVRVDDACAIYHLRGPASANRGGTIAALGGIIAEFQNRFERDPVILDCHSGLDLAQHLTHLTVFSPPADGDRLPYAERSIDIVAVGAHEGPLANEARRVGMGGVLKAGKMGEGADAGLVMEWAPSGKSGRLPSSVSIIIPAYNGRKLTEACLESLLRTLPATFCGEIVVVDDGSTDDTARTLSSWAESHPSLRILRNQKNRGFVDACNDGAGAATGKILVFLNNDVVLLPGWLGPLLRIFHDFPKAGAVGAKLISPDGTLQEAGGVVFSDGSAMNFGRGQAELEAPLFNFVREVDYCSAALLATPRALFEELGGFALEYRPGYYEDTDYCFRLRERGFAVYYQPECAVVHREGNTAGRDESKGMKQYQLINRFKFMSRWQKVLTRYMAPPASLDAGTLWKLALHSAPVA